MKKIDIDFNNLIWEIHNKSKEEIFNHIKKNYKKLNSSIIASIEIFLAQFGYWGKLSLVGGEFEELERRSSILKSHTFDLMWLYDNLGDYRSKIVLFGIINCLFILTLKLFDIISFFVRGGVITSLFIFTVKLFDLISFIPITYFGNPYCQF